MRWVGRRGGPGGLFPRPTPHPTTYPGFSLLQSDPTVVWGRTCCAKGPGMQHHPLCAGTALSSHSDPGHLFVWPPVLYSRIPGSRSLWDRGAGSCPRRVLTARKHPPQTAAHCRHHKDACLLLLGQCTSGDGLLFPREPLRLSRMLIARPQSVAASSSIPVVCICMCGAVWCSMTTAGSLLGKCLSALQFKCRENYNRAPIYNTYI